MFHCGSDKLSSAQSACLLICRKTTQRREVMITGITSERVTRSHAQRSRSVPEMGKRGSYVVGLRNAEAKGYEPGLSDAASYECPYKVRRDLRNAWATGWDRGREDRQKRASE